MALVRVCRPTFLRDTGLSVLFGAIAGAAIAAVVALAGFPGWGETLLSFLVVFSAFFVVGLAMRGLLHAMYSWVDRGLSRSPDDGPLSRSRLIAGTRPVLGVGAGSAGAAASLGIAFLLGTGETGL